MKYLTRPVRKALDRAQRRFTRSRSGSVLILVVALLVLMALIGTAYMTMAQFDRVAATQHTFNTEVDLLVEGVINQVKGVIGGDLFVGGQFRPATVATGAATTNQYNSGLSPSYTYYNGVGYDPGSAVITAGTTNSGNWWLGSKVPGLSQSDQNPPNLTTNVPLWPFITGAITGAGQFDSPLWEPGAGAFPVNYTQRSQVVPYTTDIQLDGQFWPAFTGVPGYNKPILAADADGDGIADSGLVKLLTLDGITYYAAVRIVDNSAAINASIAQTPNPFSNYTPNQFLPGDLSPVNVDLEGMLVNPGSTYGSWSAPTDLYGIAPAATAATATGPGLLPNFRFNKPNATTPQTLTAVAIGDNATPRGDFVYLPYPFTYPGPNAISTTYIFDQQWLQLGRRLRNPGYIGIPASPTDTTKSYQALPISESMAMARNFILRDPSIPSSGSSASVLEMRMPNTTFLSPYPSITYPTNPYLPSDLLNWFTQNFYYWSDFDPGRSNPPALTPTFQMRPLLTAQNPVSNFSPGKFNPNPGSTYQFGDMVTAAGYKYVCICPGAPAPAPATDPDPHWTDPYWAWEPWTNAPTKTSVNTGTFQQLYAAYWAVMADQYNPAAAGGPQWTPAFPNPLAPNDARMFRNPIRGGGSGGAATRPSDPALSNQQVMELRAAIAAVNTMALRHGDPTTIATYGTNDVISRTVYLPAPPGGVAFQANVYGAERQPYLTQVYARNDSTPSSPGMPNGSWMAVEFYNPYPNAISLTGWVLATLDRSNPASLTLTPIGGGNIQTAAPGLTNILPYERIVLMSDTTPPNSVTIDGAPPPLSRFIKCSGLSNAFGKELVLMRPRRADGTVIGAPSTTPNNWYTELTAKPDDFIPIDSYDFTNMPAVAPTSADVQEWWYIRPSPKASSDPAGGKQWHFVYPGPWQLGSAATSGPGNAKPPTWSGTSAPNPILPTRSLVGELGIGHQDTSDPPGTVPWSHYHDTAIQVNNVDFGGPLKATAGAANNSLPLGAFPRNGDILQVTFIGAYRLCPLTPLAAPTTTYELNSISADSAMATACDQTDGQQPIVSQGATGQIIAENVGRFAPIDKTDAGLATAPAPVDDFAFAPTTGPINPTWRYHWATRLFDFLTVQAPQDDYFPNVDPWLNDLNYPSSTYRYTPATTAGPPLPVANISPGAANAGLFSPNPALPPNAASEDTAPVDGLVNINTAPWRVLAAIPWVPATQANYRVANATIAVGLARYRDVDDLSGSNRPHGPFRNLFELGEAKISTAGGKSLRDILLTANSANFSLAQGNLTPLNGSSSGVAGDFQALFNTITRVSNLVTTRSDSYTAYILVQGWRNAETAAPHLVVQRRAAVIIDRSGVTPTNKIPGTTNVPMN